MRQHLYVSRSCYSDARYLSASKTCLHRWPNFKQFLSMTTSLGSRERIQPNGILNALWPMGQVTFYSNPKLYHFVSFKRINLYHGYQDAPRTEDTSMAWCPHFCHNVTSIMTMYRAIMAFSRWILLLSQVVFRILLLKKWSELPPWGSASSYKDHQLLNQMQRILVLTKTVGVFGSPGFHFLGTKRILYFF